jgi:hypothetical protein
MLYKHTPGYTLIPALTTWFEDSPPAVQERITKALCHHVCYAISCRAPWVGAEKECSVFLNDYRNPYELSWPVADAVKDLTVVSRFDVVVGGEITVQMHWHSEGKEESIYSPISLHRLSFKELLPILQWIWNIETKEDDE